MNAAKNETPNRSRWRQVNCCGLLGEAFLKTPEGQPEIRVFFASLSAGLLSMLGAL
jgi:hypothetical protein